MSDSNASAAPRKRAKLSDHFPTSHKAGVYAGEEVSFGAAQKTLDHGDKPAAEGDGIEGIASSAQVWNTTELLEHIISYLPGKSMVVVSGVNKMAYNCVANSSIAQSKLFMRPSGREENNLLYCEFYRPSSTFPFDLGKDVVAQSFEPNAASLLTIKRAGVADTVARGWVSMVDLCPLLELDDAQETTALGRLKRKGWQNYERANLTGLPAENTRYTNMILTDPPVDAVGVELTYKHNLWPLLTIKAKRHVESKGGPLTIGAVLRSACSEPGDTYQFEPPMPSNNYGRSHSCLQESTVDNVIPQTVQEHGGSFTLDLKDSQFVFQNPRIVVPSMEERMEVDANRAE